MRRVVVDLPDEIVSLMLRGLGKTSLDNTTTCYAGLADKTHIVYNSGGKEHWKIYEEGVADENDFRHQ